MKEQSSVYTATLKATKNNSIAEITYTGRADGPQACRKRPRKINLELPALETSSWWREDGYGTMEEEESLEEEDGREDGEESEEQ